VILLVDNYDSFTYNLVDYLLQLGSDIKVFRNDDPIKEIIKNQYTGIILSPGPGKPDTAGYLMELIGYYEDKLPILGICLGHQAIGLHFGAQLERAQKPMHGKLSTITIKEDYLFNRIPPRFKVVRYHSLVLEKLHGTIEPIAFSEEEEIMAIRHRTKNIRGLQFHPEAILTEFGFDMIKSWVKHNQIY
jgi:anthranilate synthase/aminodeoxychorismate synthase-like glutamine amidotransferase